MKWNDGSGYQEAVEKTGIDTTVGSRDWGCGGQRAGSGTRVGIKQAAS